MVGTSKRPTDHVSRAAVSLAWLLRFAEENRLAQRGLTTLEVVTEIVVPRTTRKRCRYTTLLLEDKDVSQRGAVSQGRPFFFISHAWGRPFAETLGMVEQHFLPEQQRLWRRRPDGKPLPPLPAEEAFVWFDIFAINQHTDSGQQNADLAALGEVVFDAQETLMVLDQYGSPLTRIWCLYEAWQTGRAGRDKLRLLSYGIEFESLEKVFLELDVNRAKASVEADRVRILADISKDVGSTNNMTHQLKDALVAGAVSQVPPAGDDEEEDAGGGSGGGGGGQEAVRRVTTAAALCKLYGRLKDSEPLYRRALSYYERTLGPNHDDTLNTANNYANLLRSQGLYGEAEALYRRVLVGKEQSLGAGHANTLSTVNNLASVLQAQGHYDEAGKLYGRALEGTDRMLGPAHPNTLTSANNLANLLQAQGKYGKAEALYRRALEGREAGLGPDHPNTLTSVNNLANLLQAQGKYDQAEALHRRALQGRERVLGPDHPDTLNSVNNLAFLLKSTSKLEEARELYRRAVDGRRRVLGHDHPDTLTVIGNLTNLATPGESKGGWSFRRRHAAGVHLVPVPLTLPGGAQPGCRHSQPQQKPGAGTGTGTGGKRRGPLGMMAMALMAVFMVASAAWMAFMYGMLM